MAAFWNVVVILVCLWQAGLSFSYQEIQRTSKLRGYEESNDDKKSPLTNRASKKCRSDTDCVNGEYCHAFHRLCLRPQELVTVAPVKTSAKRCSKDSNCKTETEYCHGLWKICLPSQKSYVAPPTKRPSGYCRRSRDCKLDEQCHKRFHACYKRPRVTAVRRDTGNSRPRCEKITDCGTKFHCHAHFRICLENKPTAIKPPMKTTKSKTCRPKSASCPKGMLCHDLWSICYTPAPIVTKDYQQNEADLKQLPTIS